MNKKISTTTAIFIIVVCAILAGGIVIWQYLAKEESELTTLPVLEKGEGETKEGEAQKIRTKNGDYFFVVLEANPTTGYQWEVDFNPDYIQLADREYVPSSPELVGSGGEEFFSFLALKSGETEITFSYLRPWEKETPPIDEKVYEIIIR